MIEDVEEIEALQARINAVPDKLFEPGKSEAIDLLAKLDRLTDSMHRHREDGWTKIGITDGSRRRSTWVRLTDDTIELCAGREGDDEYVVITAANPAYFVLRTLLSRSIWIAEGCG